jgi:hypothetical protein
MGAYTRPDSTFWWIYLESSGKREPTAIPVGSTRDQKRLARLAAEALYHRRMVEDGSSSPDSDAKPDIFFSEWATKYDDNVIAHHRGREREREILKTLLAGFSYKADGRLCLLREIDRDLVIAWRTERRSRTYLTFYDTKNGETYERPISKRLRAALDAVPVDSTNPEYYFPRRRRAKSERDRRNVMADVLRRACTKAGVPYGRGRRGLTFHWATRRTGTTRMLQHGGEGAIAAVQRIGGWKSANVPLTIYSEVATPETVLTLSPAVRTYLATGATDLRRSIHGLAASVSGEDSGRPRAMSVSWFPAAFSRARRAQPSLDIGDCYLYSGIAST